MPDPGDQNLFEQQRKNLFRSRVLVAGFVLFFLWLGLGGDWIAWQFTRGLPPAQYHHTLPLGGLAMLMIGIGLVSYIRATGPDKVLWSTGAREVETPANDQERQLVNVVEEMAVASGLPRPRTWIVDDPDPNAFATGIEPAHANIAVTTGLLATCNRDELQAVIAHELGHVKNLDMRLMTLMAGLVGAVALMSDGLGRSLRWGVGGRNRSSSDSGGSGPGPLVVVVLVLWIVSWILAPIITRLMAVAISRNREYLADAMSAQFTRNPMALANALQKIESADSPTTSIKGGVAHLCITDPLGRHVSSLEGVVGDVFATHPPMAIRIARLKAIAFQAQKAAGNFQPT